MEPKCDTTQNIYCTVLKNIPDPGFAIPVIFFNTLTIPVILDGLARTPLWDPLLVALGRSGGHFSLLFLYCFL